MTGSTTTTSTHRPMLKPRASLEAFHEDAFQAFDKDSFNANLGSSLGDFDAFGDFGDDLWDETNKEEEKEKERKPSKSSATDGSLPNIDRKQRTSLGLSALLDHPATTAAKGRQQQFVHVALSIAANSPESSRSEKKEKKSGRKKRSDTVSNRKLSPDGSPVRSASTERGQQRTVETTPRSATERGARSIDKETLKERVARKKKKEAGKSPSKTKSRFREASPTRSATERKNRSILDVTRTPIRSATERGARTVGRSRTSSPKSPTREGSPTRSATERRNRSIDVTRTPIRSATERGARTTGEGRAKHPLVPLLGSPRSTTPEGHQPRSPTERGTHTLPESTSDDHSSSRRTRSSSRDGRRARTSSRNGRGSRDRSRQGRRTRRRDSASDHRGTKKDGLADYLTEKDILNDNSDEDDDIQSMLQSSMASMPTVSSAPSMMRRGSNNGMPTPTSSKVRLEIKNNVDSRKMGAWLLREQTKDPQGPFSTNSTKNAQWDTKQQEESLPSPAVHSPGSYKPAWQLREQARRRGAGLTPKSPKIDANTKLPPAFRQLYKANPQTPPAKPKELITNHQEWQKRKVQSKQRKGTVRESIAAWLDDDEPRTRVDVL